MRRATIIFVIAALFLFASCLPRTPEPPYGVWVSEEPRIVLFLRPEYRIPIGMPSYVGFYTIDDVETKVFAHFGTGLGLEIYHITGLRRSGGISGGDNLLLSGSYRVVNDQIRFRASRWHEGQWEESTTITFHRLEYYDPIDPYYWFPHFFPRSEDATIYQN